MDKLSEHAIRMLEITDANDIPVLGNPQFRDISRAVYDFILLDEYDPPYCKNCKGGNSKEECDRCAEYYSNLEKERNSNEGFDE